MTALVRNAGELGSGMGVGYQGAYAGLGLVTGQGGVAGMGLGSGGAGSGVGAGLGIPMPGLARPSGATSNASPSSPPGSAAAAAAAATWPATAYSHFLLDPKLASLNAYPWSHAASQSNAAQAPAVSFPYYSSSGVCHFYSSLLFSGTSLARLPISEYIV